MGQRTQIVFRLTTDRKSYSEKKRVLIGGYHNQWGYGMNAVFDAFYVAKACYNAYSYEMESGIFLPDGTREINFGRLPSVLPSSAFLYFLMDVLEEDGETMRPLAKRYLEQYVTDKKVLSLDDIAHNRYLSKEQREVLFASLYGDNNDGGVFVDRQFTDDDYHGVPKIDFFDSDCKIMTAEEYVMSFMRKEEGEEGYEEEKAERQNQLHHILESFNYYNIDMRTPKE